MDAIVKLVRLMANLLTYEKIGIDFIAKYPEKYKFMIRNITAIVKNKSVDKDAVSIT